MTQKPIGRRIADLRKAANLTQEQFAGKMGCYSVHAVRAIERGRDQPSPAFKGAAAAALGVGIEDLNGTPYLEEEGPVEGIGELRTILAEGAYVRALEPPPEPELVAKLVEVEAAIRNDRTRRAVKLLPELIREVYGATRVAASDGQRLHAYTMLCDTWIAAEAACCRLGYTSLTALTLDRLDEAALKAGDPRYAVRSLMKRARLLMSNGANEVAMNLVEQGLGLITGDTEADRVLLGYAHLRGGIVAARQYNLDLAKDHVGEARRIAEPMTHESDLYTTMFGPGNVEVHACSIELEAGDPGKAARDGSALILPPDMAAPRAGHHWQDNARAWLLSGKPDEAMTALTKAKKIAPQQTRLHPSVRDTYEGILTAQRRSNDPVASFGRWLGKKV